MFLSGHGHGGSEYSVWVDREKVHAVIVALVTAVMCLSAGRALAENLAAEEESTHRVVELRLTILADGSVGVDYSLNHATRSLRLSLPRGRSESFRLEPVDALVDANGVVVLPNVTRSFRIVISPDRPAQRWARGVSACIQRGRARNGGLPALPAAAAPR